MRQKSQQRDKQSLEPIQDKRSGSPQTIQTYSDFKDSLSDSEREKFFNFVREQIKNLPKPVNDLEAWLASKSQAGENRWFVYYSNFLAQGASQTKVTRNYPSLHDEIEERRAKIRDNFAKKGN